MYVRVCMCVCERERERMWCVCACVRQSVVCGWVACWAGKLVALASRPCTLTTTHGCIGLMRCSRTAIFTVPLAALAKALASLPGSQ